MCRAAGGCMGWLDEAAPRRASRPRRRCQSAAKTSIMTNQCPAPSRLLGRATSCPPCDAWMRPPKQFSTQAATAGGAGARPRVPPARLDLGRCVAEGAADVRGVAARRRGGAAGAGAGGEVDLADHLAGDGLCHGGRLQGQPRRLEERRGARSGRRGGGDAFLLCALTCGDVSKWQAARSGEGLQRSAR